MAVTLSVIVPCFNVAGLLPQTLESLRRNAAPGFEFVLVDDGSTDDTPAVLARGADRLPGARVLRNPTNRGLSAARNVGLDAARGQYLTFLDGDDLVAPGHLDDLLASIRALGCELVRTDHVQLHGRRRRVHRISHGPRGTVMRPRDAILPVDRPSSVDAPHAWAGIYHRSLADRGLLRFSERLRTCEDRPWCWRLHLQADTFAVVGLTGLLYRRGVDGSLTQTFDERQLDFIPAFDQIIAEVLADREATRLLPKAVRGYAAMICHHLGRADRYPPAVAERLQVLSVAALSRLPVAVLGPVVDRMDPGRRTRLRELRAAA